MQAMDDMLRVASLAKEPLPGTCCVVSWGERILGGGGRQQLGPLKYSCHVFWKGFLNSFDFFLKREGTQQKSDGRWTTWDESNELGQKDEGKVSMSLRPGQQGTFCTPGRRFFTRAGSRARITVRNDHWGGEGGQP